MTNWKEIWEKKGNSTLIDLRTLDGFENTSLDEKAAAAAIIRQMNIQRDNKILEVGCGAGMISQFLDCDYTGIDYSSSLLAKHRALVKKNVYYGEANSLPFDDKAFDKSFAFSVFQYFPNHAYAEQVISEMKRVTKSCVFIGDLPITSHSPDHLVFRPETFLNWIVSPGFYNLRRFNVFISLAGNY